MSKCDVCDGPMLRRNQYGVCQHTLACRVEYQRRYNKHKKLCILKLTDEQLNVLDEAVVVYLRVPKIGHDQMILDDLRCKIAEAVKAKETGNVGTTETMDSSPAIPQGTGGAGDGDRSGRR